MLRNYDLFDEQCSTLLANTLELIERYPINIVSKRFLVHGVQNSGQLFQGVSFCECMVSNILDNA